MGLSGLKIRTMGQGDHGEMIAMINRHFPHVNMTHEKLGFRLANGAHFFVAEGGAKIAGFIDLQIGKTTYIRGLAVLKEFRGKGLGTMLIMRALDYALKQGKPTVLLKVRTSNTPAIAVYKKLGFRIRKTSVNKMNETIYIMAHSLET